MAKRFSATIHGRVQGVGFRFFAREAARDLGVVGFVRNTSYDAVEVVAEGEDTSVDAFLRLLERGPRSAHVTRVDVSWESPTGQYEHFFVKP